MRVGIISNADWVIDAIELLQFHGHEVHVFTGDFLNETHRQSVLSSFERFNGKIVFGTDAEDLYAFLTQFSPDYCFIYGWRRLIDISRPGLPKLLNVHHSSLPAYRGLSPVFWQIRNGEARLGVSIHKLSAQFDKGPVLWKSSIPNTSNLTSMMANQLLAVEAAKGMNLIISGEVDFNSGLPENVPASLFTAPQFKDVSIFFSKMSAKEISNLIRACMPWNNGAFAMFAQGALKLSEAWPVSGITEKLPGTVLENAECLQIACSNKTILEVKMLYINDEFIHAKFAGICGIVPGAIFN